MYKKITVGSCFSGIGGIELGLERTGYFETKWQIEKDEYASKVLTKHWPAVKRFGDIKSINHSQLESVDLICGGFPCQDISGANTAGPTSGTGLSGERSGLWREFLRTIRLVRPKLALVENVPKILDRSMGTILGDLAETGMDVEWNSISAHSVGREHRRLRVFIMAYAKRKRRNTDKVFTKAIPKCPHQSPTIRDASWIVPCKGFGDRIWAFPNTGTYRVPDGIPNWVHRLRCLGNSVVPQVSELLANLIFQFLAQG